MSRRRRRQHGSPVSFFAFQDIITSVTGILILVTLLLTLEVITRAETQKPGVTAENIQSAQMTLKVLQSRRDTAKQEAQQVSEVLQQVSAQSPASAVSSAEKVKADLAFAQNRTQQQRQENERLATILRETIQLQSDAMKRLRNVQARVTESFQQASEAEQKAKSADDELAKFGTSGKLFLLPAAGARKQAIIVQCTGEQISAGKLGENGVFTDRKDWRALSTGAFLAWTNTRASGDEYFVLMVNPDAVPYAKTLIVQLRRTGFDVGWDALPNNVALFQARAPRE